MAKKQTRRSISVSRVTYERLKAFCEANNISMSQLVETRVNDFLHDRQGSDPPVMPRPSLPQQLVTRPSSPMFGGTAAPVAPKPVETKPQVVPITSAAARYAVEPPPPIIKPRQQEQAPKPAEKRPDQIFTF